MKSNSLKLYKFLENKRISFDIDGVIVDTKSLALKIYNKKFKEKRKNSELVDFNTIRKWIFEIIKDDKQAELESSKIWNHPDVLLKAKPVSGAVDLNRFLINHKMELKFITSRPNNTKEITLKWFNKWFPWINKNTIFTSNSEILPSSKFKAELVRDFKIDIHFEDSVSHAEEIIKKSPRTTVVLVRQPWNINIDYQKIHKSIIVAKNSRNVSKLASAYQALVNANN